MGSMGPRSVSDHTPSRLIIIVYPSLSPFSENAPVDNLHHHHYESRISELEMLVRKLELHNKVLKKELYSTSTSLSAATRKPHHHHHHQLPESDDGNNNNNNNYNDDGNGDVPEPQQSHNLGFSIMPSI
jgi:hypothetical protein